VRGLYQYLAGIASDAGAEIFVGSRVVRPLMADGEIAGLEVSRHGRPAKISAPLVIDATGVNRVLARKLGIAHAFDRVGVGAEYDLRAPAWPQERVTILFGSSVAPNGYGWIFPHGDHRVRVGVGIIRPDSKADPKEYVEKLLTSPLFREEFARISRLEYHAGLIPGEPYCRTNVADHFMLAGDAGALISTLLGEGIRFAIDIGRMAGKVAAESVRKGRFDRRFLQRYETNWRRKYKRVFDLGVKINRRLSTYSDEDWDAKIALLSKLSPAAVAAVLKGDFSPGALLSLTGSARTLLAGRIFGR